MSQANETAADEAAFDETDVLEDDGVLDASDTLSGDAVEDPLDVGIVAADHWAGADRFGTTAAEQRAGEPLDQLLAQEEPDIDPYAETDVDDEDELTRRGYEREPRSGRLADDDGYGDDGGCGEDEQADLVAWDAGVDGGGASAEEAAMHIVDDPNGPGHGPLR